MNPEDTKWLHCLEEVQKSDLFDEDELKLLVFVRDLLLAPDEDENVTTRTLNAIQEYYRATFFFPDEPSWKKDPGYGSAIVVSALVNLVFQVARSVPYNDVRLKRLADLLIGLKKSLSIDAEHYNPEDPRIIWKDEHLLEAASETSHAYSRTYAIAHSTIANNSALY
jgi:hypothetical protein